MYQTLPFIFNKCTPLISKREALFMKDQGYKQKKQQNKKYA